MNKYWRKEKQTITDKDNHLCLQTPPRRHRKATSRPESQSALERSSSPSQARGQAPRSGRSPRRRLFKAGGQFCAGTDPGSQHPGRTLWNSAVLWADCLYFDSGAVQDSGNPDSIHKSVFKASFCWCSLRCYRMGKLWTTFQSGRKYRFYCHIYPAGRRSVRDCIIFGAGNCEI